MQQQSAAWWAALPAASAQWSFGLDILASDEQTPLETLGLYDSSAPDRLLDGSAQVALDVTVATRRSLSLSLRNGDGRYLPGPAGYPSGGSGSQKATGLVWMTARYRPWMDLRTGWDANGNPVYERTPLGLFVLTQPQVNVTISQTTTYLSLLDKSALLQKPYRLTASNLPTYTASGGHSAGGYAAGSTVDAAMRDLASRGGVASNRIHFEPNSTTLPADYPVAEGDEPWTHLTALATSLGDVLYFDAYGFLVRRPNPLGVANSPSLWTVTPGPLCTIASLSRTPDYAQMFNHTIALGGSSTTTTYRGEAQVTDPASPYHKNAIGDRVVYVGQGGALDSMTPDPLLGSTAAAQTVAQTVLAQHLGQQETVQMQARNHPALEGYDRLTVNVPAAGLNLDVFVQQVAWQLGTGGMTLTAGRWVAIGS